MRLGLAKPGSIRLFCNLFQMKRDRKSTRLNSSHLVISYAVFCLKKHSATNAVLIAAPVDGYSERVYQVFGKEVLDQLIAVAAAQPLERIGLPQPPPWSRTEEDQERSTRNPGEIRLRGFVSKPEIQKLNRNSIYVFVNGRLI